MYCEDFACCKADINASRLSECFVLEEQLLFLLINVSL